MYWCWSGGCFPNWSSTVADGMKHLFRYLWCARMLIQLENPVKCGNIMHFSTVRFFGGQIIYLEATFFKLKIRVVNEGIFSCFVWMKCQWIIELSETGRKLCIDRRTLPYHWKSAKYRHANRRSGTAKTLNRKNNAKMFAYAKTKPAVRVKSEHYRLRAKRALATECEAFYPMPLKPLCSADDSMHDVETAFFTPTKSAAYFNNFGNLKMNVELMALS